MANGFIVVEQTDWNEATPEQRDSMIFSTLKSIDERLKKLEKRPVVDKCFSFAGGLVGGAAAAFGIKWGA